MKFRKVFLRFLLGLFALWVLSIAGIHLSYSSYLPRIPHEESGQTYHMVVNHGSIRYGTEREFHALKTAEDLRPTAILLFLLVFVLGLRWGIFKIAPGRKLNE